MNGCVGDLVLRVEIQQILIAAGLVVQETAQRAQKSPLRQQPFPAFSFGFRNCSSQLIRCKSRNPPGVSFTSGSR